MRPLPCRGRRGRPFPGHGEGSLALSSLLHIQEAKEEREERMAEEEEEAQYKPALGPVCLVVVVVEALTTVVPLSTGTQVLDSRELERSR